MGRRVTLDYWISAGKPVLVDTNVLVTVFRAKETAEEERTPYQKAATRAFGLIPGPLRWVLDPVRFEFAFTADLPRDQRTERQKWLKGHNYRKRPVDALTSQRLLTLADQIELASKHVVDGLIAAASMSSGAAVLTNDRDFTTVLRSADDVRLVQDLLPEDL
jgi:predicted nucleic acid-binding protein